MFMIEHLHPQEDLTGIALLHGSQNLQLQSVGRRIVMGFTDIDDPGIGYGREHLFRGDPDAGWQVVDVADNRCGGGWIGIFRIST